MTNRKGLSPQQLSDKFGPGPGLEDVIRSTENREALREAERAYRRNPTGLNRDLLRAVENTEIRRAVREIPTHPPPAAFRRAVRRQRRLVRRLLDPRSIVLDQVLGGDPVDDVVDALTSVADPTLQQQSSSCNPDPIYEHTGFWNRQANAACLTKQAGVDRNLPQLVPGEWLVYSKVRGDVSNLALCRWATWKLWQYTGTGVRPAGRPVYQLVPAVAGLAPYVAPGSPAPSSVSWAASAPRRTNRFAPGGEGYRSSYDGEWIRQPARVGSGADFAVDISWKGGRLVQSVPKPGEVPPHEFKPPPENVVERKVRWVGFLGHGPLRKQRIELMRVLGLFTESTELVDCMFRSIPGHPANLGYQRKLEYVFFNLDKIDPVELSLNLLGNEFEDRFYGRLGRGAAKFSREAGLPDGIQVGPVM